MPTNYDTVPATALTAENARGYSKGSLQRPTMGGNGEKEEFDIRVFVDNLHYSVRKCRTEIFRAARA